MRRHVITTSVLFRCFYLAGGASLAFRGYRSLLCTSTSPLDLHQLLYIITDMRLEICLVKFKDRVNIKV